MSANNKFEPAFPVTGSTVLSNIGQTAMSSLPDEASVEERERVYMEALTKSAQGISVLDYFAAAALQGICSLSDTSSQTASAVAARAYELAHAMLSARAAQ